MSTEISLGDKLRALRRERKYTQRELAGLADVSANSISLIERGEISPSVATLQNLATALKIKISYFFDEDSRTDLLHLKADQRPAIVSDGLTIETIGKRLQGQQIEPFLITLTPNSASGDGTVVHLGHEFVYCLRGRIDYQVDNQTYQLEPGDMLLFTATLPHRWQNTSTEPAEMLVILQSQDDPTTHISKHFRDYPSLSHLR